MQITQNTTGMSAGLTVAADPHGRDHCVVVVKGTFVVSAAGELTPAEQQEPLIACDVPHGDPAVSSLRYECEFALTKPRADVLINGSAFSPSGRPVESLDVSLEIGERRKVVRVTGDRIWERGLTGIRPSEPSPFSEMPLRFERAFGGSDHSHADPRHQGTELRNPVGVGFHKNPEPASVEGRPLPNLEDPESLLQHRSDTPPPVGFGSIGRAWQPRAGYAGTYDERWLAERFPFLPEDFDPLYFQSAPLDQQLPLLRQGERIRCLNMSPDGPVVFTLPAIECPVRFRFRERDVSMQASLDTLLVEPDQRRVLLLWRASVPIGRKLVALREVLVGRTPVSAEPRRRNNKPYFRSLDELVRRRRRSAA